MEDDALIALAEKYRMLKPVLNERARRLFVGAEARAIGRGGVAIVSRVTGVSRLTISRGLRDLDWAAELPVDRVRRPGGGRKRLADLDPTLDTDLEALVEPSASGHPQSAVHWTSRSVRHLANQLQGMGHNVSYRTVARRLSDLGYTLQANRKDLEESHHPDRDAQFRYIGKCVRKFQRRGQPVISVDTKKKEKVGDFQNGGKEWRPKGTPERVRVHDFIIPELGKAVPYGIYDLTRNAGWVSVGIDHDTASFAVHSIHRWWQEMGRPGYPDATEVMITADSGGSNAARSRLWKVELQRLADVTGLKITVCHFPPGTSKWNKIEHRLFSYISKNWRGKPLVSLATIVNLIARTGTATGLRIRCELDNRKYPKGIKVSDNELAEVRITKHAHHGEWNYTIRPKE